MALDCCEEVANELQAEFIYDHVEDAKAVAGTEVKSVGIHDDLGIVHGPSEEHFGDLQVLHETGNNTACGCKEGIVAVLYPH